MILMIQRRDFANKEERFKLCQVLDRSSLQLMNYLKNSVFSLKFVIKSLVDQIPLQLENI